MVDTPDKPNYTHGAQGSEPDSPIDYSNGDAVDSDEFDYFVYQEFDKIRAIIDVLNAIDSDEDNVVDAADTAAAVKGNDIDSDGDGQVDSADEADNANNYKGNDIDGDGDGTVDEADSALTYKGNDIDSDGDGTVDQADDTLLYKGNDIDSDGDGKVDNADQVDGYEADSLLFASEADDLSDISTHRGGGESGVALSVTGSGKVLGGHIQLQSGTSVTVVLHIDGTSNSVSTQGSADHDFRFYDIPPISFDSSFEIEFQNTGASDEGHFMAHVKQ